MFQLFFTLYILLFLGRLCVEAACSCQPVIIPAKVDALVPKDPTDPFAGLKSDLSDLRRLDVTYSVYGVFCQPEASKSSNAVQLLVHGFTYNNQYWSPAVEEFQNYSYASFSCERGMPSLAIDCPGVGFTSRPPNASDVQIPIGAGVISRIANHLKTSSIISGVKPFNKVIGVGHSLGSLMLNFGAITEGEQFPFDGIVLTGYLNVSVVSSTGRPSLFPARDIDPLRWSDLDPNYITTDSVRTVFYPPNPNSFSPRMILLDDLTKDVGSVFGLDQIPSGSLPVVNYTGHVAKVVGSEDLSSCVDGICSDVAALRASESTLWPAAKSFDVAVSNGSGHDLNLDFFALNAFNIFFSFVEKFSR
ncbi:hypothetical protein C8J56DRAFT_326216 [Mycena floridula]|nr:hypothetical protein C8J56DRAFT_326216 [Mycena floridula]